MTHKDLIAELAMRLNWTQAATSETLDAFIGILNEKLADNVQISIQNFGTFETKKKQERISVNPLTQERFLVPPKITATFKPSAGIKEQLRNNGEEQ